MNRACWPAFWAIARVNTPVEPPPPRPGYTGQWNLDRFLDAMRARGIDPLAVGASVVIAKRINDARLAVDEFADLLDDRTVRRWLSGAADPSKAAGGRTAYIWEICRVFAIDPAWLMTGEAQP